MKQRRDEGVVLGRGLSTYSTNERRAPPAKGTDSHLLTKKDNLCHTRDLKGVKWGDEPTAPLVPQSTEKAHPQTAEGIDI